MKEVKFIFVVDFVVIDVEEDKQVPLLLGRPFLATGVAFDRCEERRTYSQGWG